MSEYKARVLADISELENEFNDGRYTRAIVILGLIRDGIDGIMEDEQE